MRAYGDACCRRAGMAGAEMHGVKPPPPLVYGTKAMPAAHMTFTRVCSPLFCIRSHLPPLLCLDYPRYVFLLGFLNLRSSVQSDFPSLGSSFPRDCTWLPVSHNTDAGHADTRLRLQISFWAQSNRLLELDTGSVLESFLV